MVEQAQHADAQRSFIATIGLHKNVADLSANPVFIVSNQFEITGNYVVVDAK